MSAVLRLKRKACNEPVDGLVVALKKSRCDDISNKNEVYFKFAATLKSETESVKDHIQAVLSKDRSSKYTKWRAPKTLAFSQKSAQHVCEKYKNQHKAANEKKRLDLLNNRRLIFSETVPIEGGEENLLSESADIRELFQLYDIIEENEEVKKQSEKMESAITCNDEPLICEKSTDYVYDVYIADVPIDDSFVKNTVSVRPCNITDDDIYFSDSDNSGECYEDDDDSNDENNWRNEYPEDEESHSERDSEDELGAYDAYDCGVRNSLNCFGIGDEEEVDSEGDESYDGARILKELSEDSDQSEEL